MDRGSQARSQALTDIVALARVHGLSAGEIATALGEPERTAQSGESRTRSVVVRVLGYLGGTFVFAGIGIFIALQWDGMNSAARVLVTLGSGLSAFVLAWLAARDHRYDKAATPLFLIAAALEPTGMLVAFNEFGSGGDWRWASLITSGTMALQFGATFTGLRLTTPLFMTVAFGTLFWWSAFDLLDVDDGALALVIGASLLLAAVGIDRTIHGVMTPIWYLIGGTAFLYGLFDIVEGTPVEPLFIGGAAAFVYMSVNVRSRTLLFVATAAILAYTAYFTGEHFADSAGWPLALVVIGLVMIALSALAVRIDRRYMRGGGTGPAGPR